MKITSLKKEDKELKKKLQLDLVYNNWQRLEKWAQKDYNVRQNKKQSRKEKTKRRKKVTK